MIPYRRGKHQTSSSSPQTESTGEEIQQISQADASVDVLVTSITDGPGHSILQTPGQAQGGGEPGEGVGYDEFNETTITTTDKGAISEDNFPKSGMTNPPIVS